MLKYFRRTTTLRKSFSTIVFSNEHFPIYGICYYEHHSAVIYIWEKINLPLISSYPLLQFVIQVSHIFQDASTGSAVKVLLVKLIVIESEEVSLCILFDIKKELNPDLCLYTCTSVKNPKVLRYKILNSQYVFQGNYLYKS